MKNPDYNPCVRVILYRPQGSPTVRYTHAPTHEARAAKVAELRESGAELIDEEEDA